MRLFSLATLAVLLAAASVSAQSVSVTFRFLPDLGASPISPVVRAFVPGSFNNWGPNSGGQIAANAASRATYNTGLQEYRYTTSLQAGQAYEYKIHYHENTAGTTYTWLTDPLGTETTGPNSDSVIRVSDLFVFQIAREQEGTGMVQAVSAGVFGTASVASVAITVNGTRYTSGITDTGNGIYRLALPTPVAPSAFVRIEATDSQGRSVTAEVGVLAPPVTDAPVPDGLADGITYDAADPSRAWLVLRAPSAQFVYALGGFNDWTATDQALMNRDANAPLGTRWWMELTGLTPGTEVPFYYWVDGQIRVADPYTTKVYYPGEAQYPSGAQTHAVGVLTPGAQAYPWTDAGFQPPALEDLVVYELLLRDFLADHSFTALTDTLDYLDRLGVNAIELMPVAEFDGDESWGYNPAFHLALDKYYGTPDDFKAFVDAAHARGIAVLLDVVYNHATGQSPLIRLDNQGDFGSPTPSNPWANVSARHPFNVFNDLNHESPLTQLWLDQANRFWMDEYHIDGYRFDLSKGFVQSCGGGDCTDANFSTYNPDRIAVLTRMADALWAEHPDALVILEHFAEPREEQELAAHGTDRGLPGMALWANMNEAYLESAMGYLGANASLERAYPPSNGYPLGGQIAYMESHDEPWMLYKVRAFGNQNADYSTRDLATALDRRKLATAFFLTLPGPKMLWQFGEVGYGGGPGECLVPNNDCPSGTPGRVDNKPIRWDYWQDVAPFANGSGLTLTQESDADRELRRETYALTANLLTLRERYSVFQSGTTVTSRLGAVADRWIRLSRPDAPADQPTEAVVVGNFGITETDVAPGFPASGTWYEYFSNAAVEISDPAASLRLQPGEYRIYTNQPLPAPQSPNTVDGEDGPGDRLPEGLVSVYPNPTAHRATARIEVYTARRVTLEVYDTLGRRVATLADREFAPGGHSVDFDTSALPAGVYLVRWGWNTIPVTVTR